MERPILFSAEMVRAILEGRKTMTRRVIKPKPDHRFCRLDYEHGVLKESSMLNGCWHVGRTFKPPYGKPGDSLYVRETWRIGAWNVDRGAVAIDYKADGYCWREWLEIPNDDDGEIFNRYWLQCTDDCEKYGLVPNEHGKYKWSPGNAVTRWRPSIHMPRFASRLTLNITDIRVERLQDISREDAKAEGIPEHYSEALDVFGEKMLSDRALHFWDNHTSVENFQWLWDSINGKPRANGEDISWQANPYVWVVSFEKAEGNHG